MLEHVKESLRAPSSLSIKNSDYSHPYWLEEPLVRGNTETLPNTASIVIIGSGLSGASAGYFLKKNGFEDVLIIDDKPEISASYRNCGHILYGTVESMKAMVEIHGKTKARELWAYSIEICDMVRDSIESLEIDADYRRDGYLVLSISQTEDQECRDSVALLNSMQFQSEYFDQNTVSKLGFKNCFGARFEKGSAQAHPTKFRNGIINHFLSQGGKYFSGAHVLNIQDQADGCQVQVAIGNRRENIHADAVVICANAYSPLFSDFFKVHGLIEPFRGQIIASKPLAHEFKVTFPHSFDHGYEYALVSEDNRLILGGWRNHSSTGETGTYSLATNSFIENGLKNFAKNHYAFSKEIAENIEWEYSWSGIMAASKTGLPFIGPTSSPRVFACCAYTGHGFSWAHGSAKLLADIIAGNEISSVARFFNPKTALS